MSFFNELKRRNVFRVGIAYAVAAWLLLQIVDLVLENINAPDWVMQVFMLAMAVGFPIALIIAWAFEVTPDGVKLAKNVEQSQSINRHTGHQLNRGIIMILSVAIVFLLTDRFRDQIFSQPQVPDSPTEVPNGQVVDPDSVDSKKSIAVLPFRDMSAAQDQDYFGEGIAEELLNALVKLDDLHVASRTSTFSLVDEDLDIPTIAARLGVNHVLEGSIRTSGKQVRVTAQLIQVSNDVHLWSETYDGTLDDIFKIQDEITRKIADAMKVQLGLAKLPPSADRLTSNVEAYQMYLQGRQLWRQRNSASLGEAIRLFKEAVRLDPRFHRAWSNLAIAYVNLPDYDRTVSSEEYYDLGLAAAEKALEIWPQSTEALVIIAEHKVRQCDITGAAREFEKALAFNPEDPTAQHWYAIMLLDAGHTRQALEHIQAAHRLDPMISAVLGMEARMYLHMGDYTRANDLQRKAASLGLYGGSLYPLGLNYLYEGEFEKGRELVAKGWAGESPGSATITELFLKALDDPAQQKAFESHIGKASAATSYSNAIILEYLTILRSSYLFDYLAEVECPYVADSIWLEPFREQRVTPEFYQLMERTGMVDYWREFGWPDDCASLDQNLAECP